MQLAGESTAESSLASVAGDKNVSGGDSSKKPASSLDKYEVFQEIGEGAFGLVNLAKEKATGQIVAIKAVNIQRICQLNKERHILREKELFAHLKHNNIIQLYATFKDDKNLYFVFENGPRGTLDDMIKKTGGLNEEVIKIMFGQLINCYEFIMSKGIMHRDLKPQNIMLDDNYNMKIIDFGDARIIDEPLDEDESGGPPG